MPTDGAGGNEGAAAGGPLSATSPRGCRERGRAENRGVGGRFGHGAGGIGDAQQIEVAPVERGAQAFDRAGHEALKPPVPGGGISQRAAEEIKKKAAEKPPPTPNAN